MKFEIKENKVVKEGNIQLRQKSSITHYDLPIDYLHIIPGTTSNEIKAGLFKTKKTNLLQH